MGICRQVTNAHSTARLSAWKELGHNAPAYASASSKALPKAKTNVTFHALERFILRVKIGRVFTADRDPFIDRR